MNYFIDENLGSKLTGIEKAQINRIHLFEQGGLAARGVTMHYNTQLHLYADSFDVHGRYFSMYDFFQGTKDDEEVVDRGWIDYWENVCHFRVQYLPKTTDVRIHDGDNFRMYAHFMDKDYKTLDYVNYFDTHHVKTMREIYDTRGFCSQIVYLTNKQKVASKVYLNRKGERVMEDLYDSSPDLESKWTQTVVRNFRGRDYFFDSQTALRTFFFNQLYEDGDLYISDRNLKLAEPLDKTDDRVKICGVIHSTHAQKQADVANSPIKSHYRYMIEHPDHFSKIICSTDYQRRDLVNRFPDLKDKFVAIPVGFTTPVEIDPSKRLTNRVMCVARFSPEKQIMQQAEVIKRLVPEFPDVELHLFGYGKGEKELRDFVAKNHLEKNIIFRGFLNDLSEEYQKGTVSLLTSIEEGFSLATLEAQNYGVPVISYDIRYGPREIIDDNVNGFLIKPNDQDALYERLRRVLRSPQLQKTLSAQSVKLAQRFSEKAVLKRWETVVDDVLAE
ncbi:glycosyltransferase [Levilactobacillus tangyuanensis]|uniref:Glycosyltransferase n=1 Tax=Levilactobacillus tangyuanensis TaxID=2486021 RepID=A0ABW1TM36_9LACO|nr:glycosyltransferase [Levilactobacillus tangyuanensis]